MSATVKTRILTPEEGARWARKFFDVYRVYHRRLKMTARLVGVDLLPHADALWKPWADAFLRRERVNRRTTTLRYRPVVTPVGNLHDIVARVCGPSHKN